jgi:hypothetical protein
MIGKMHFLTRQPTPDHILDHRKPRTAPIDTENRDLGVAEPAELPHVDTEEEGRSPSTRARSHSQVPISPISRPLYTTNTPKKPRNKKEKIELRVKGAPPPFSQLPNCHLAWPHLTVFALFHADQISAGSSSRSSYHSNTIIRSDHQFSSPQFPNHP